MDRPFSFHPAPSYEQHCYAAHIPSASTHASAVATPAQHTTSPIVTGTSIVAVIYKDGVMMAADTLASYGSLARFRDVNRIHKVTPSCILGASGDISDYQYVQHLLEKLIIRESQQDDGHSLEPEQIYTYLSQVMYARRNKVNPLWNQYVVAGCSSKPFLGFVDLRGTMYKSESIATGYGAYLAQPILRKAIESRTEPLMEPEAVKLLEECMRVLYYRDARSLNKIQFAKVTKNGVEISQPFSVATEWTFAEGIRGYGSQVS